jgi:hypothetical protein
MDVAIGFVIRIVFHLRCLLNADSEALFLNSLSDKSIKNPQETELMNPFDEMRHGKRAEMNQTPKDKEGTFVSKIK